MIKMEELKDYQVLGANLQNIMGGFGSFTLVASKFLLEEGMGKADETMMAQFEPTTWYPLDKFLRVVERIHGEFGNFTLRQVGLHVPKNSQMPPHIDTIQKGFAGFDVGYHLNHGYNNQPLFNPQTGELKGGIGHYKVVPNQTPNPNTITLETDVPYPCPFDEGVVTAFAQKFKPSAIVTHTKTSCRMRGGATCTYVITWK